MKTLGALAILLIAATTFVAAQSSEAHEARQPMLVSTAWLERHLHDPGMLIFHVSQNRREYRDGHIPGARFLWTQSLIYSDPDLSVELPTVAQADSALKKMGYHEGVRIILYSDGANVTAPTRMYFTLDYLGLGDHVSVLDGGLDAWKAEGRPINAEIPETEEGSYVPKIKKSVVVRCDWLKDNLKNPEISIVDARGAQFYAGTAGGMPRAGHIPNAVNIPFSSLVDSTNKLKDLGTLRKIFQQAGVKPGSTVVSYCHVGLQATVVYFVARYLGYEAQVFDGSFEEWSGRKDLPIELTASSPAKK